VPQGSALGPLVLHTYVNDICKNSEFNIRLFADDGIIYKKKMDSSHTDNLQIDLNKLVEWAVENEMKINPGKRKAGNLTKAGVKERIMYYFGDQLTFKNRASYI
jgi:hypothetical protein